MPQARAKDFDHGGETTYNEWRRSATDVFVVVSAYAYLPAVALIVVDLPVTPLSRGLALSCYLAVVAMAAFRRVDHRLRAWVALAGGYVVIALNLIVTAGPLGRAAPVALPVMALVLIGVRSGRVATALSAALLISVPLLSLSPSSIDLFAPAARAVLTPSLPKEIAALQSIALIALFVTFMIQLERFHLFVLRSLAAQRRAASELKLEVAEHAAARQALEQEMRERRQLEREIIGIGDRERRRLGQDIHDGVCQELTGALLRCQTMEKRLERGDGLGAGDLGSLNSLLQHAIGDARAVARGLCPLAPGSEALAPALRALVRRTQLAAQSQCEFRTSGDVGIPDPEAAHHLYRIAQEALQNATRHARAGCISAELRCEEDVICLVVQDDGVGLPDNPLAGGMGLRTMTYRAQMLNGELTLEEVDGGGTRVVCRIPRLLRSAAVTSPIEAGEGVADGG